MDTLKMQNIALSYAHLLTELRFVVKRSSLTLGKLAFGIGVTYRTFIRKLYYRGFTVTECIELLNLIHRNQSRHSINKSVDNVSKTNDHINRMMNWYMKPFEKGQVDREVIAFHLNLAYVDESYLIRFLASAIGSTNEIELWILRCKTLSVIDCSIWLHHVMCCPYEAIFNTVRYYLIPLREIQLDEELLDTSSSEAFINSVRKASMTIEHPSETFLSLEL